MAVQNRASVGNPDGPRLPRPNLDQGLLHVETSGLDQLDSNRDAANFQLESYCRDFAFLEV
eukprot:CAMPEP_0113669822 /NCGR_PEP_ID=MMETSP0038_2-20120614/4790_1 /TAXON_ID=2898 /ORGANISM="Cryptomonas paramecium" /LENGTH=60 /DNA_ID=CAMNT_0000585761 /DNA_START=334 /DNA_END=516 /DNA_ORIENTATION=+ /assembly_acc=CAM_ASM_000170